MNKVLAFLKRTPALPTGIGIAGMLGAMVLTGWGTVKAVSLIKEKKEQKHREKAEDNAADISEESGEDSPEAELSKKEVVMTVWKAYVPAAAAFAGSAFFLIFGQTLSIRNYTELLGAYKLSQDSLTEYCAKTLEVAGPKKEAEIRDAVAKEQLEKHPVNPEKIFITNGGDTLCFDPFTGRYFRSSADEIRRCINILNRDILSEGSCSLNDFYDLLGLDNVKIGDCIGWDYDISDSIVDPRFSSQLDPSGEPCLVLGFSKLPDYGFDG